MTPFKYLLVIASVLVLVGCGGDESADGELTDSALSGLSDAELCDQEISPWLSDVTSAVQTVTAEAITELPEGAQAMFDELAATGDELAANADDAGLVRSLSGLRDDLVDYREVVGSAPGSVDLAKAQTPLIDGLTDAAGQCLELVGG